MKAIARRFLFADGTDWTEDNAGMKQDGTIALFRYWDRLRQGRPAPRRTDVEPSDIKSLLANTFILERDMRGEPVFRLAGTRLCAMYGRELKSYGFLGLWPSRDRALIARLTGSAFSARSVVVVHFEAVSQESRSVEAELLLLPLDGGRDNPRALGSIQPLERPFWIGTDPIHDARILSVRVVDPEREHLFLANRPAIALPPSLSPDPDAISRPLPPDTTRGLSTGGRKIRHLVVYKGGRDG